MDTASHLVLPYHCHFYIGRSLWSLYEKIKLPVELDSIWNSIALYPIRRLLDPESASNERYEILGIQTFPVGFPHSIFLSSPIYSGSKEDPECLLYCLSHLGIILCFSITLSFLVDRTIQLFSLIILCQ